LGPFLVVLPHFWGPYPCCGKAAAQSGRMPTSPEFRIAAATSAPSQSEIVRLRPLTMNVKPLRSAHRSTSGPVPHPGRKQFRGSQCCDGDRGVASVSFRVEVESISGVVELLLQPAVAGRGVRVQQLRQRPEHRLVACRADGIEQHLGPAGPVHRGARLIKADGPVAGRRIATRRGCQPGAGGVVPDGDQVDVVAAELGDGLLLGGLAVAAGSGQRRRRSWLVLAELDQQRGDFAHRLHCDFKVDDGL
jgi:hypothetical protein